MGPRPSVSPLAAPQCPSFRVWGRDGCGMWHGRWLGPGSSGPRLLAPSLLHNVSLVPPQLSPGTTESAVPPLRDSFGLFLSGVTGMWVGVHPRPEKC